MDSQVKQFTKVSVYNVGGRVTIGGLAKTASKIQEGRND